MIMVDPLGPMPLYEQMADIIAARIESGEYPPNRAIPSEATMVQEFGTARETVRRAVKLLVQRGLVRTVQARGTFVLPPEERPEQTDQP